MVDRLTLAVAAVATPIVLIGAVWLVRRRMLAGTAIVAAVLTCILALAVAGLSLVDARHPVARNWIALDAAAGLLSGVIGLVGLVAVLTSPSYLASQGHLTSHRYRTSRVHLTTVDRVEERRERAYYSLLFAFWAVLLAVPLAGNLGAAWLLVEATTAASALLVGFTGKPRALEAGWKYLILTSLGLGIALLGIVVLAAGLPSGSLAALSWRALPDFALARANALAAYVLLLAGLATKVGWAPVHNWLPDAHSEAPAPISSMLSSALLPAVVLVAWRCEQGFAPVVGEPTARGVLIAFGIASIGAAVPFLARSQSWKRLLAYSSLEHMGVIALGIGFATPLALTGVAIHIVGHAIAKTLGFSAATPLVALQPAASDSAVAGIGRTRPELAAPMALSLGALSGLPPLPLFVSEVFIVAGGIQAGHPWLAAAAAGLMAMAFLGLMHSLFETTGGQPERSGPGDPLGPDHPHGLTGVRVLAAASVALLLALTVTSVWLAGSDVPNALRVGLQ